MDGGPDGVGGPERAVTPAIPPVRLSPQSSRISLNTFSIIRIRMKLMGLVKGAKNSMARSASAVIGNRLLLVILIVALLIRLPAITNASGSRGETMAFNVDEVLVMDPTLRVVESGDPNPHYFNYPSLYIYTSAAFIAPLHAVDPEGFRHDVTDLHPR